jgi:lipooligosaccharide transport system ATP-binding protein
MASPSQPSVVALEGVSKRFGDREVVRQLSFEIAPGSCFGLLGPNGAGKTTTLRMIYGVTRPSGGSLRVFGLDATAARREIRSRLGVTLQDNILIQSMSAEDNLRVFGRYHLLREPALNRRVEELMDFLDLRSHAGMPVETLSGGYQRRLSIAMSLMNRPELLVLDEPTTGLDPAVRLALWSRIRSLKDAGTTILLTTHYMDEAQRLCDRVAIMSEGRVVCDDVPDALIARYLEREVVEFDAEPEEAASWPAACVAARDALQADRRLMLFAPDAAPVVEWVRAQDGGQRRPLVVRPANLEDVFLRVSGTQLEGGE